MSEDTNKTGKKVFQGRVVSDKMEKTITVTEVRKVKHKKYLFLILLYVWSSFYYFAA